MSLYSVDVDHRPMNLYLRIVGGLFLAAVATLTGVYFGWRKDRREAEKFRLEIELLKMQRDATQPE